MHNYQRIEKPIATGILPIFVVGNGGYWHLHNLLVPPGHHDPATDATLVAGTDSRHGFGTLEVSRDRIEGHFTTVPRPQESWSDPKGYVSFDRFSYSAAPLRLSAGESVRLAT